MKRLRPCLGGDAATAPRAGGTRIAGMAFKTGAIWAVLVFVTTLRADLAWKTQRLVLDPPPGATEAAGVFEFVNRGSQPVRIEDVRSSCGCTAMASQSDVVRPGEKGSVRAVFHAGGRKGRQEVAVFVTAREPDARIYELKLEVALKEFATVTPGFVYWKLGDEPGPRMFQVSLAPGFRLVSAAATAADFTVEVVSRSEEAAQLRVVPRDTWAKRSGTIKIMVAQGDQPPIEVLAYARVL